MFKVILMQCRIKLSATEYLVHSEIFYIHIMIIIIYLHSVFFICIRSDINML